jgi:hypothetical protein
VLETEVGRSGLPAVGSGSRETRQGGRIWRTQCCSKCWAPGRSIFLPAARARGEKDADKGEEKPKKHVGQKPKKPAAGSARVCLAKLEASQLAVRGAQGRALRSGGRIRHRWRESRSASGARRSHVPISGCCGAFRRRSADPPGPPSVARRGEKVVQKRPAADDRAGDEPGRGRWSPLAFAVVGSMRACQVAPARVRSLMMRSTPALGCADAPKGCRLHAFAVARRWRRRRGACEGEEGQGL